MRLPVHRLLTLVLPLLWACGAPADQPTRAATPRPIAMSAADDDKPTPSATAPADALGTRGEVILVVLGPPFPADVLKEVETMLAAKLDVEVRHHERIPLPKAAYTKGRRRYRAEKLLDLLLTLYPKAPPSTRVLGLTTRDISTTKGKHKDWGIFGLGLVPGQAAVVSMHRLKRCARDRKQLRFRVVNTAVHEVGHTFGLSHCPEDRCPMADAEGSIASTDRSTGHLGPQCQATLDEAFPRRPRDEHS